MTMYDRNSFNSLGDRMKAYESAETSRRFIPMVPIYARLDGRSFSKLTKSMNKPYDVDFSACMKAACSYLVDKTNANIGYTQSDEISLCWLTESLESEIFFNGKIFKMTSNLAAMATLAFYLEFQKRFPVSAAKNMPTFDCRIFQVPNKEEAINCFVWREMDATRNSVSMLAQSLFSHKQLDKKGIRSMLDMIHDAGYNWNDQPTHFKRGTYFQRKTVEKYLTDEELNAIPEKHRPSNPVLRTVVVDLQLEPILQVSNIEEIIFGDKNDRNKI